MSLAKKIEGNYQRIVNMFVKNGIEISTDKLDRILEDSNKYQFNYTKIYSENTYEAFLNLPLESKRNQQRFYSEEIKNNDFYHRNVEEQKEFIYEISVISDIYIAHILNFILESGNEVYIENFKIILRRIIFNYKFRRNKKFNTLEDYIIDEFKRTYITLKIKSKKSTDYEVLKSLKNSYLFNFMCTFDIVLTTQTREKNELFMETYNYYEKYDEKKILDIEPKVIYNSDLIIHFKKAMSSTDIATQYLSFYHIIEYYFDSLYNEYIIAEMKRWFANPQLSLDKDSDILKFVDKAKKFKGKSSKDGQGNESDALLLVLENYVDLKNLKEKLSTNFTKEKVKKIYGVNIDENNILDFYKRNSVKFLEDKYKINFNSKKSKTVYSNIRNRIYDTRNSLVHNKDRYNLKKYHPYDDESELRKEIPLIKMIAMEIIISTSNKINIDDIGEKI